MDTEKPSIWVSPCVNKQINRSTCYMSCVHKSNHAQNIDWKLLILEWVSSRLSSNISNTKKTTLEKNRHRNIFQLGPWDAMGRIFWTPLEKDRQTNKQRERERYREIQREAEEETEKEKQWCKVSESKLCHCFGPIHNQVFVGYHLFVCLGQDGALRTEHGKRKILKPKRCELKKTLCDCVFCSWKSFQDEQQTSPMYRGP